MSRVPHIEGVLSADEVVQTANSIAALQLDSGMIPWFKDGHCDPWNHVETAIALDIAGLHHNAERAYEWLVDMQHPDGWWFNYYLPGGIVEEPKLDTNVCAYIASGVWHHWMCTWDRGFVDHLWPTVERAIEWVVSMRRHDGTILWAKEEHASPWDYALLTGSSSIWHALTCAVNLAELINEPKPHWAAAADQYVPRSPLGPTLLNPRLAGQWTGTTQFSPKRWKAIKRRLVWPTCGTPLQWRVTESVASVTNLW